MPKTEWKNELEDWFTTERVGSRWNHIYSDAPPRPDEDSFRQRRDYAVSLVHRLVPRTGRVLDLGCGAGIVTAELLGDARNVVSLDYSLDMLGYTRDRLEEGDLGPGRLLRGDAGRLPFPDSAFDCVVCLGVISYQEDYQPALQEIRRVLKPGGVALITFRNVYHAVASDPWELAKALGRLVLRGERPHQVGLGRALSPGTVRRAIERAGLLCHTFEGIGLGPFSVAGRRLMGDAASIRLSNRLTAWLRRLRLGWTLRWSADVAMFVCRSP